MRETMKEATDSVGRDRGSRTLFTDFAMTGLGLPVVLAVVAASLIFGTPSGSLAAQRDSEAGSAVEVDRPALPRYVNLRSPVQRDDSGSAAKGLPAPPKNAAFPIGPDAENIDYPEIMRKVESGTPGAAADLEGKGVEKPVFSRSSSSSRPAAADGTTVREMVEASTASAAAAVATPRVLMFPDEVYPGPEASKTAAPDFRGPSRPHMPVTPEFTGHAFGLGDTAWREMRLAPFERNQGILWRKGDRVPYHMIPGRPLPGAGSYVSGTGPGTANPYYPPVNGLE